MRRYFMAVAAAMVLWLSVPAAALAGPAISVSIGVPGPFYAAPWYAPVFVVNQPGPDYIWVSAGYCYDDWGRYVWMPAHWRHHDARPYPVVVRRSAPKPQPVVVHRVTNLPPHRDAHDNGNHHDNRGNDRGRR